MSSNIQNPKAAEEEFFINAFQQVKDVQIQTPKDLQSLMSEIKDNLNLNPEMWEKRIQNLKLLRSIIKAEGHEMDDFFALLRPLQMPIQSCVADLRSQVVREACITIAFMTENVRNGLEPFVDFIMQSLLGAVNNTVKIMSLSAMTTIKFIVNNTPSQKLFIHFAAESKSKSIPVRRFCYEMLALICVSWPDNIIKKNAGVIQDILLRGVADADQESRSYSRRAFTDFYRQNPAFGEKVLQQLDPMKRKQLTKELTDNGVDVTDSSSSSANAPSASSRSATTSGTGRPGSSHFLSSASASARQRPSIDSATSAAAASRMMPPPSRRLPVKKAAAQSQPVSREVSPNSGRRVPMHSSGGGAAGSAGGAHHAPTGASSSGASATYRYSHHGGGGSNMPRNAARSQQTSRESSPSRNGNFHLQRPAAGRTSQTRLNQKGHMQDENNGNDVIDAFQPYKYGSSAGGDDVSDISSNCSETPQFAPTINNPTDNLTEILQQLTAHQWTLRLDGLQNFQNYLDNNSISQADIKRVYTQFSKMFAENQSKVFLLLMATVQKFIMICNRFLTDWLYILLIRLFSRQGTEMLKRHQKSIKETLEMIRSCFALPQIFACTCRYIIDPVQTPSLKVKVHVLEYMRNILGVCKPDLIEAPTQDVRLAMLKIITWNSEVKSGEVRKASARFIVKLFDLNCDAFTNLLKTMPSNFQETVNTILHTYVNQMEAMEGNGTALPLRPPSANTPKANTQEWLANHPGNVVPPPDSMTPEEIDMFIRRNTDDLRTMSIGYDKMEHFPPGLVMQQQFSEPPPGSWQSPPPQQDASSPPTFIGNRNSSSNVIGPTPSGSSPAPPNQQQQQQSLPNEKTIYPDDMMAEILRELSNHNDNYEQRRNCMNKLIEILRDGSKQNWDEYFKPTLLLLVETLVDNHTEIRALSLRALQELARVHATRFKDFVHLTLLRVLEAHNDAERSVVQAAEKCCQALAQFLDPNDCLSVLSQILTDDQNLHLEANSTAAAGGSSGGGPRPPSLDSSSSSSASKKSINMLLAVLKTQSHVYRHGPTAFLHQSLANEAHVSALISATEHPESSVRKSAIYCLLEAHKRIGEEVWDYLTSLSENKSRLLRLYIKRQRDNVLSSTGGGGSSTGGGGGAAQTTSSMASSSEVNLG